MFEDDMTSRNGSVCDALGDRSNSFAAVIMPRTMTVDILRAGTSHTTTAPNAASTTDAVAPSAMRREARRRNRGKPRGDESTSLGDADPFLNDLAPRVGSHENLDEATGTASDVSAAPMPSPERPHAAIPPSSLELTELSAAERVLLARVEALEKRLADTLEDLAETAQTQLDQQSTMLRLLMNDKGRRLSSSHTGPSASSSTAANGHPTSAAKHMSADTKLFAGRTAVTLASSTRSNNAVVANADNTTAVAASSPKPDDASMMASTSMMMYAPTEESLWSRCGTAIQRCLPERGFPEHHGLVAFFDAMYVLTTTCACGNAVFTINAFFNSTDNTTASIGSLVVFGLCNFMTMWFVIIRFFTAVRVAEFTIVDDLPSIRAHYLRTWFPFDILHFLPLELIFYGWLPLAYNILILRNFLRFFRMVRLGESGNPLLQDRMWMRFLSIMSGMVVTLMICANVFLALTPGVDTVQALYWALATMTTVGYGDIVPVDDRGRILAMVVMVCGAILLAVTTSFVTSVVTKKDPIKEDHQKRKEKLQAAMAYFGVPWDLQKEAIAGFPTALEKHAMGDFRSIVDYMPSDLSAKLMLYSRIHVVRRFKPFANASDAALREIAVNIKPALVPEGEHIITAGDEGHEMFFIVWGVVAVYKAGKNHGELGDMLAVLRHGDHFGEIAVILDENIRTATVVAHQACELLVVDRLTVRRVASEDANVSDALTQLAEERKSALSQKMHSGVKKAARVAAVIHSSGAPRVSPRRVAANPLSSAQSATHDGKASDTSTTTRGAAVSPPSEFTLPSSTKSSSDAAIVPAPAATGSGTSDTAYVGLDALATGFAPVNEGDEEELMPLAPTGGALEDRPSQAVAPM